ncbi:DegT/DnrJ/EryC1/StrS family aminotransferase [Microbacterium sp. Root166]|uniref:DegT/DnrJ/EryC1/StrS family aminotransferase n=1 Tax=Microbacterium sp. Root166 TaxID=1736478 RepID=UPI002E13CB87
MDEVLPYLEEIWQSHVLTNAGPLHERFERELAKQLGVKHVSVFANGTVALMTALQAVAREGEVITTPFSFVATSNAIVWNRLIPVFVDVDPVTLNLDPTAIEAAITPRTTAILAVHCYGHPCEVEAIEEIARRHGVRVIYDAAHAFGVTDEGGSILRHGDLSVLSFHATKVFNTFEGGAIVSGTAEMKARIDELKNFGIVGETSVVAPGINGKMSEFGAAMGLAQLKHVDDVISRRGVVDRRYRAAFGAVRGIVCLNRSFETRANFAYFPVLIGDGYPLSRDDLVLRLREHGIFARRYFYPVIPEHPMYKDLPSAAADRLPIARDAAARVVCLPIYPDLALDDVDRIIKIVVGA